MVQVSLAKAKSSFSEYASRAAYTDEHIIVKSFEKGAKARSIHHSDYHRGG